SICKSKVEAAIIMGSDALSGQHETIAYQESSSPPAAFRAIPIYRGGLAETRGSGCGPAIGRS
ncbi:hypothetical protein RCK87_25820, partial [Salmonella enterica subsp. enterica serovar 1,4,[5],12:i:-]